MSKSSVIMLSSTQGQLNVVGEPLRADGWYGYTDGLHTVAMYLVNFTGQVYFQASIASQPTDNDWFPIDLTDISNIPQLTVAPYFIQKTATLGFNIVGNFTWLRVGVDRTYLNLTSEQIANQDFVNSLGIIDHILLNS